MISVRSSDHDKRVRDAAELFGQCDSLLITAGAGMSADSGLPTYRGRKGFWRHYPALAAAGLTLHGIANPAAFRRDAARAWGFYGHRLLLYRCTPPHEGYRLLLELAKRFRRGAFVYTSNVDGHFDTAGFDPALIWECHGSIHHLQCLDDCSSKTWTADDFMPEVDETQCRLLSPLPRCPNCGAMARPNVLMFGDPDWNPRRALGQSERFERWRESADRVLVIELGAGTDLPRVREFGTRHAHRMIRINPERWRVNSGFGVGFQGWAFETLRWINFFLTGHPPNR